ncbi:Uncharacterised protein [Mycobacteroides abscessus subsp. abscessus]|nr:Uncharacterised protein [Mycobacteroides abscessus subsp. abscessus]
MSIRSSHAFGPSTRSATASKICSTVIVSGAPAGAQALGVPKIPYRSS